MKKIVIALIVFLAIIPGTSEADGYSQDTGKITTLFVHQNGDMAFLLSNGYTNAIAQNQCSTSNGFAGIKNSDTSASIKAAILTAKTSNAEIVVTISGCTGGWYNVTDIYIK